MTEAKGKLYNIRQLFKKAKNEEKNYCCVAIHIDRKKYVKKNFNT